MEPKIQEIAQRIQLLREIVGMKPEEVIERLSGIRCGGKPTSCPDQLARALQAILRKREGK